MICGRWEGGEDAGESFVEIDLRAVAEGTELAFIHSRLRDEGTRLSHKQGWSRALEKLVQHFLLSAKGEHHGRPLCRIE